MNPFTRRPRQALSSLGESGLITAIRDWLGPCNPRPPYGIGDDCAVLPPSPHDQVITVDPVVFGRHFDAIIKPADVGAKLLKRNLSDIAAMGAKPSAAVVALVLDPTIKLEWLEQFYRGLAACARIYHVAIVGGDIAQAPGALTATLTLLGQATAGRLLTRTGASIGDSIYVTGVLGGSLTGHHYQFKPRLKEGAWLASRTEITSMMDVSDGLAKDLHALVPKGAYPELNGTSIPIAEAARRKSKTSKLSPLAHALSDGEDYELLFTVSGGADQSQLEREWQRRFRTRLSCIGKLVRQGKQDSSSLRLERYRGYEHLR